MMWDVLTALIPWEAVAAAVGAVVLGVAAWITGRRSASQAAKIDDLEGYQATRKAIDDATDEIHGDDPAAARRFLSERGKSGGNL